VFEVYTYNLEELDMAGTLLFWHQCEIQKSIEHLFRILLNNLLKVLKFTYIFAETLYLSNKCRIHQ